jgi:hypothetical protein
LAATHNQAACCIQPTTQGFTTVVKSIFRHVFETGVKVLLSGA